MGYVHDEKGWRLGIDGEYHTPFVEVDGQWVLRSDFPWAEAEDERVRAPVGQERLDNHQVVVQSTQSVVTFEAAGITVLLERPAEVDAASGAIALAISSAMMGERELHMEDGILLLDNVTPEQDFSEVVVAALKAMNQIDDF